MKFSRRAGPPQIEIAVLEAQRFAGVGFVFNFEGRRLRLAQNFQPRHPHLDFAGVEIRVRHPLGTFDDHPLNGEHPFAAHPFGEGMGGLVIRGVGHHLGDAVAVAQVDENQAAVVAVRPRPAHEDDFAADVRGAKRSAMVGSSSFQKLAQYLFSFICARIFKSMSLARERIGFAPGIQASCVRLFIIRESQRIPPRPIQTATPTEAQAAVHSLGRTSPTEPGFVTSRI